MQCEDIDFDNGILKVHKTVQRIKNDDNSAKNKTKVIIASPKTKNSTRKIPLPERLLEKLKEFTASKKGVLGIGRLRRPVVGNPSKTVLGEEYGI